LFQIVYFIFFSRICERPKLLTSARDLANIVSCAKLGGKQNQVNMHMPNNIQRGLWAAIDGWRRRQTPERYQATNEPHTETKCWSLSGAAAKSMQPLLLETNQHICP